jgi:hypothetical protein
MVYNHFLKAALLSAAGALISPLAFGQAQIVNITNSGFESGSVGWSKFSPGGVSYGAAPSGADATFADGNVAYIQVGYLKLASNPGPSFKLVKLSLIDY